MFRFPYVICTRCTGFFCLAIIKGPPNDIYCIIEEPYKHYFTEKVSYSRSKNAEAFLNTRSCFTTIVVIHLHSSMLPSTYTGFLPPL